MCGLVWMRGFYGGETFIFDASHPEPERDLLEQARASGFHIEAMPCGHGPLLNEDWHEKTKKKSLVALLHYQARIFIMSGPKMEGLLNNAPNY